MLSELVFAIYVMYFLHTYNKLISDNYFALLTVETNRVVQVNSLFVTH